MSVDYSYLSVTVTGTNTFTCTVADSGGTSGTSGAYIPAFDVRTFTDTALELDEPSSGNIQLISLTAFIDNMEDTSVTLTMPSNAITNGAGKNNSLATRNIPVIDVYNVDGSESSRIGAGGISFSTSSNHSVFTISGGLDIFGDLMYTLRF